MKQRTDYVTNSSSSSFIFDNKELGIEGVFSILKDYCKDVIEIIDNTISQIKSEDEDLYNKIIKINKLYEEERIAYDKYFISESLEEHGKVITSRYDWGELIDLDEYNNVKSEYDIEKIRETYGNVDNKPDEYLSMKNEINRRCYELKDEITAEDKDRIKEIVSGYIFEKFDKNSGLLGSVASTYFWLDAIFGERYIEIKRLSELNNYKEYLETFDNYTSTFKIIDIFKEMDKQKDSDYFTTIHDAFGWYGDIKGRYMIASECGYIPHIIVLLLALKAKQACEHMG